MATIRSPSLQRLELAGVKITDAGIAHLIPLANLRSLVLRDTEATDACIESLRQLPRLQSLDVRGTKISADGLRLLRKSIPTVVADDG